MSCRTHISGRRIAPIFRMVRERMGVPVAWPETLVGASPVQRTKGAFVVSTPRLAEELLVKIQLVAHFRTIDHDVPS